jgi:hypothetical protein
MDEKLIGFYKSFWQLAEWNRNFAFMQYQASQANWQMATRNWFPGMEVFSLCGIKPAANCQPLINFSYSINLVFK